MASAAHAYYCFEVLAASFDKSDHPDLQTVVSLYEQSQLKKDAGIAHGSKGATEQKIDNGLMGTGERDHSPAQIPSISRLQSGPADSRSAVSTPSSISVNSSTSQLTSSTSTSITTPTFHNSQLSLNDSFPMFVTWNVLSKSGSKSLRGCIGTFEALPLEDGLEQYALTSAFHDTRFAPIPASQLSRLSCSLTLLADFEECAGPMDWTLGTHGIRISFTQRSRRYGATYLPDVAVEQGWNQEETLESLMRKAGWEPGARRLLKAGAQPWEDVKEFKVVRYTGLKASASYDEWQEWRQATKLSAQ